MMIIVIATTMIRGRVNAGEVGYVTLLPFAEAGGNF